MNKQELEDELRVAQELLFLVLDKVGEPVVLDIEESRERMNGDRRIDIDVDKENSRYVLSVVDIDEQ